MQSQARIYVMIMLQLVRWMRNISYSCTKCLKCWWTDVDIHSAKGHTALSRPWLQGLHRKKYLEKKKYGFFLISSSHVYARFGENSGQHCGGGTAVQHSPDKGCGIFIRSASLSFVFSIRVIVFFLYISPTYRINADISSRRIHSRISWRVCTWFLVWHLEA